MAKKIRDGKKKPNSGAARLVNPSSTHFTGRPNPLARMTLLDHLDDPIFLQSHPKLALAFKDRGTKPLNLSRVKGVPLNAQSGDCGVFTLRYLQVLVGGNRNFEGLSDEFSGAISRDVGGASLQPAPDPSTNPSVGDSDPLFNAT